MGIKRKILTTFKRRKKGYLILLDPEKRNINYDNILYYANKCRIDGIMIGGSSKKINGYNDFVKFIKSKTNIPLISFPGSHYQISDKVDSMFLLTLLNSRNSRYLIEEHLKAGKRLYKSGIEIINTAYIIIAKSQKLSVIKETGIIPIKPNDYNNAEKYFMTSQLLGYDVIYLEGGSGTNLPISPAIIKLARKILSKPIIVGGGIKDIKTARQAYKSGADYIVTGNIIEQKPEMIVKFKHLMDSINEQISHKSIL